MQNRRMMRGVREALAEARDLLAEWADRVRQREENAHAAAEIQTVAGV